MACVSRRGAPVLQLGLEGTDLLRTEDFSWVTSHRFASRLSMRAIIVLISLVACIGVLRANPANRVHDTALIMSYFGKAPDACSEGGQTAE